MSGKEQVEHAYTELIDHGWLFVMVMAMIWQQQLRERSANEAASRIRNHKNDIRNKEVNVCALPDEPA